MYKIDLSDLLENKKMSLKEEVIANNELLSEIANRKSNHFGDTDLKSPFTNDELSEVPFNFACQMSKNLNRPFDGSISRTRNITIINRIVFKK